MQQGSALSSLLFVTIMEGLSKEFRVDLPWEFARVITIFRFFKDEGHLPP